MGFEIGVEQSYLLLSTRSFNSFLILSKDPGPEGPALVHSGGVVWVITFISCVQVSGVRCQ